VIGKTVPMWILMLTAAVVVALVVAGAVSSDKEDGGDADADAYGARAACAEFTRARLKAPGSADFPEYDDPGVRISHSGSTWTVRSFVDAENSFGANLRTNFACVVEDRGDQWHLESWLEI
jgi:hypothetical protein